MQVLDEVCHGCHWLSGQVFVRVWVMIPLWFAGQLRVCVSVTGTQVETQLLLVCAHPPQTGVPSGVGQVLVLVLMIVPLYPDGHALIWLSLLGWHDGGGGWYPLQNPLCQFWSYAPGLQAQQSAFAVQVLPP